MGKEENNKKTVCWYDSSIKCDCSVPGKCRELFEKYAKLVFCGDNKCLYNIALPSTYYLDKGSQFKPFLDDGFNGICGRSELAMKVNKMIVGNRKRHDVLCVVRSEKKHSHLHFPDPDHIEGGNLPDPPSSDYTTSTYHT